MTTYNAKDLIEQAQMLADLQNSDFISWKENMMFLDNAWADLYQQIINHGDKSFLKNFSFEGERCELPCDFYQLHYVYYFDGMNRVPITRKAKTSLTGGPFYDLEGNEIVIYRGMNGYRRIEVDYYPVRDSITYASDDQVISMTQRAPIDVCGSKIFRSLGGGQWVVEDIINGTSENFTASGAGVMLADSGPVFSTSSTGLYFKKDNKCYEGTINGGSPTPGGAPFTLSIRKKGAGVYLWSVEVDAPYTAIYVAANKVNALTSQAVYFVDQSTLKRIDLETGVLEDVRDGIINTRVYSFNDDIYYETKEGVFVNDQLLVPTTSYDRWHGVMKVDEKTGYGILFDNFVIKSAYANTELLFPNNVYYNYLAYKLATYYKIKQGADPGGMMLAAESALNTFYNTILKDTNEYVRISNVYAR